MTYLDAPVDPPVAVGKTARYPLARGDVARLIAGTGGGWGDPLKRPRGLVLADLCAELITEDVARRIYGLTEEELARVWGVSANGGRAF